MVNRNLQAFVLFSRTIFTLIDNNMSIHILKGNTRICFIVLISSSI